MIRQAAAVVLRSGGVLLLKRADGAWEFPAAALAAGEAPRDAAVRAARELTGLEAEAGPEAARSGDTAAFLVTRFKGELKAACETAWVQASRLLERELRPDQRPIAEVIASHKRRERYTGTHPKRFEHKYKELAGDAEAAAKARARGSTPAGAHLPIMVPEILAALSPLEGATVLDCTLGWGGHARALAGAAGPSGRVVALDRDGEELARTSARLAAEGVTVAAIHANFAGAAAALRGQGLSAADALLADLGVSSMQLDRPERGLSFKNDGPLDMRMDRSRGVTAAQWLAAASEAEIARALERYGDERDARAIAALLVERRARGLSPKTTFELASLVAEAKGLGPGRVVKKDAFSAHPATRVFQALRIAVNDERAALEALLSALPALLRPGGRAAFLTFHSGEEALVQRALQEQAARGLWRAPLEPPRKPSPEEVRENPRARSARLWRAVRAAAALAVLLVAVPGAWARSGLDTAYDQAGLYRSEPLEVKIEKTLALLVDRGYFEPHDAHGRLPYPRLPPPFDQKYHLDSLRGPEQILSQKVGGYCNSYALAFSALLERAGVPFEDMRIVAAVNDDDLALICPAAGAPRAERPRSGASGHVFVAVRQPSGAWRLINTVGGAATYQSAPWPEPAAVDAAMRAGRLAVPEDAARGKPYKPMTVFAVWRPDAEPRHTFEQRLNLIASGTLDGKLCRYGPR
jgi:16S rRNA (cytosine1402-N4)-methyltransferase